MTGSMDTGLQFRRAGLRTVVHLTLPPTGNDPASADVLVLDTESRDDTANVAYHKASRAASWLSARRVYKKIDSTLRGNIGQELDAVMAALGLKRALVTPAFPAVGRIVLHGRLSVKGFPLTQTDFIEDPLCPATDNIPALLSGQCRQSVGLIGLEVVDDGIKALVDTIRGRNEEIIVVDASAHSHLVTICAAASQLGDEYLLCGSAGLAGALPKGFGVGMDKPFPFRDSSAGRPVLVIAGSRRRATIRQIRKAQSTLSACLIEIDPLDLAKTKGKAVARARHCIASGDAVILTAALKPHAPQMSDAVTRNLADIAAEVVRLQHPAALVLTGGATALAVCRTLGVEAIEIDDEIAAGIPAGRALREDWPETKLVTKAGGFGEEDVLVKAIDYVRGQDEG